MLRSSWFSLFITRCNTSISLMPWRGGNYFLTARKTIQGILDLSFGSPLPLRSGLCSAWLERSVRVGIKSNGSPRSELVDFSAIIGSMVGSGHDVQWPVDPLVVVSSPPGLNSDASIALIRSRLKLSSAIVNASLHDHDSR
jgi:hypothetical protein